VIEWQPIETAPRDSTRIIVAWNDFFFENAIGMAPQTAWFHKKKNDWVEWDSENMCIYKVKTPDLWMPIPFPRYINSKN
jgi:hypothetical protein